MITYSLGDMFADLQNNTANAVVIPVNCVGVMGAGVALEAKKLWPEIEKKYKAICSNPNYNWPGCVYPIGSHLIFANTKKHWRDPSELDWVEKCLQNIVKTVGDQIITVGVPALGCGLGGLKWDAVKALYEKYLSNSPVHFVCYEPK